MQQTIKAGTMLIQDGASLPEALRFESEACAPGWRSINDMDVYGLDRKIHEAGWTFFCMAGEIKTIVFGFEGHKRVRTAVKRILASLKMERFNSLEVTRVASKHFLGVPYVSISARSRHIQESMFLFRAQDLQDRGPSKIVDRLNPLTAFRSGNESRQQEVVTQLHVVTTLNL